MAPHRVLIIAGLVLTLAVGFCCGPTTVFPPATSNEPIRISGALTYTWPFFAYGMKDSFVLLEDEAGFVHRDTEFVFPPESQVLGPVEVVDESTLTYTLALPETPHGTFVDVDNDGQDDTGVQVFAVAYWSNTWGDTFLERRDGTGWSNAYTSAVTDPERDNEIKGGILIVWAPDDQQGFPTGFGQDGKLFTEDDPVDTIPAGYNIVDLDQQPFHVYKEAYPQIDLQEGQVAVNDYSSQSYQEAFDALFQKMSLEYPFTWEKRINWNALHDEFAPEVARATTAEEFYRAIRGFTWAIPDGHIGVQIDGNVFYEECGGGFGMVLAELSDGRVIVTQVLPGLPAEGAGIAVGAEIIEWNRQPVSLAIDRVQPYFGPYSTEHRERLEQVAFLTRTPPFENVDVTFQNPYDGEPQTVTLTAEPEYDSLIWALPYLSEDELALPVEGQVLDESGLGYIKISTFAADYNLMADLWWYYMNKMIENNIPGLILDVRDNGGGNSGLALDFAGYFFDEEIPLSENLSYNELSGQFEVEPPPTRLRPGPALYDGPVAVLVSPNCVSACEGFAYAMAQGRRATIVGHYPTAGSYGGVGLGQCLLPDGLSFQFPTSKSETPDGQLVIEGSGVQPDIVVPVTEESALGQLDAVLNAAIEALQ